MSSEPLSPHFLKLDCARALVLEWLREAHRNPKYMAGRSADELRSEGAAITARFLSWTAPAGFLCVVISSEQGGAPMVAIHWSYRDSELIGFKQPPVVAAMEDALMLACAALLENEWCAKRLP